MALRCVSHGELRTTAQAGAGNTTLAILLCLLLSVGGSASAAPSTSRPVRGPGFPGRWMVSLAVGNPGMASVGISRVVGDDLRLMVEFGSLIPGIIMSGSVHLQLAFANAGRLNFYGSLSGAVLHFTGLSWGGAGPPETAGGIGLQLGMEYAFSFGLTLGLDAGFLAGNWHGIYGSMGVFMPQITLIRAGWAW